MEGIPALDVADYKRRKEIERGLAAGSISQPPPKSAEVENRPLTEELRRQLAEHKALMGLNAPEISAPAESSSSDAIYGTPQTYASPPPPTGPPSASILPSCPLLMSGFPLGYVMFSTSLSLSSHVLATTFQISYASLPAGCPSFPPKPSPIPISTFPPTWNIVA